MEAAGGTAVSVTADVTDSGRLQSLVRESVTRTGGLDIAVNNAGILRGTVPSARSGRRTGTRCCGPMSPASGWP
ncbi:SDR family oxidoreductase [Micromonospora sp. KC723]|uniref:SDR family oxidoreductase n=1 Tax=Micromonospora sp. KC723 TaxID=2530381 RepID=UPI00352D4AD8